MMLKFLRKIFCRRKQKQEPKNEIIVMNKRGVTVCKTFALEFVPPHMLNSHDYDVHVTIHNDLSIDFNKLPTNLASLHAHGTKAL